MKLCTGCKHLLPENNACCTYESGNLYKELDPYTKAPFYRYHFPKGRTFHKTTEEMRSASGSCGLEAKLYAPTGFQKLKLSVLKFLNLI